MARVWVSGEFEGWYRGERAEMGTGNQERRTYTLRLYKGFLDAPKIVEPPQLYDGLFDVPNTFRQSDVQTTIRNAAKTFTLNDVRIHDWRTAFQTEDQGEVFGTIFGIAYGWIDDGQKPPPPPAPPQPAAPVKRIEEPQTIIVSTPATLTSQRPAMPGSGVRFHRGSPRFGLDHQPTEKSAGCALMLVLAFVCLVAVAINSPGVLFLILGFLGLRLVVAIARSLRR